jgi:hypothetical protein
MSLLAWRGMPDENGAMRDDHGELVQIGDNDGDMRPSPVLAQVPFGPRSVMSSKWQDLGVAVRRMTTQGGDSLPGGVNVQPGLGIGDPFGPQPSFAGTDLGSPTSPGYGFVAYENDGQGGVRIKHNTVASGSIVGTKPSSVHKGQNVYEVRLGQSVLGSQVDRYAHYAAQLLTGNAVRGEFRILGHDANTLYLQRQNQLSGNHSLPEGLTSVKVLDKFFWVFNGNVQGFSQVYQAGGTQQNPILAPRANIRIGFAFHKDPGNPDLSTPGEDQNRLPKRPGTFLFDMNSPGAIETIRSQHLRYVKWHVLFDTSFQATTNPNFQNNESLGPLSERPQLRMLVTPFRY